MRRPALLCIPALLLIGALASCSETSAPDVLTTTTILADVTRNVAGERLAVGSLLPLGTDPHSYQPSPQDTARISSSKVLIVNGAGYEHFLEALLENAGGERALIEASAGLRLGDDPHFWLDPNLVVTYVENIRAGLVEFDPEGEEIYQSNARAYITQLEDLDAWISEQVTQVPPERRLLVTNHEAFGYFGERYGFTIVGTVIESFSSDASPSARQMAALIDQIREHDAPAIFLDASDNPALAEQIAAETGVKVVTNLHLESLTEGPPAATYIDMLKYNVTQIVAALK
ncbi:MAG: metal ABC transporter substrate-binding protein [Anaerolineales bacterium]